MKPFKLKNEDKQFLIKCGYPEEDLEQIEEAANKCRYTTGEFEKERPITRLGAIRKVGREKFLTGIARAAFHWTSTRYNDNEEVVQFDCSRMFH